MTLPGYTDSAELAAVSGMKLDLLFSRLVTGTPLMETVTVSRDPAPLGPSIRDVDSVRRSLVNGRSALESMELVSRSHGIRVRAAPLKSSRRIVDAVDVR